jgi:hypothetical protein
MLLSSGQHPWARIYPRRKVSSQKRKKKRGEAVPSLTCRRKKKEKDM